MKMLLIIVSLLGALFAQENPAGGKPAKFENLDACKAAVISGEFAFYNPSDLSRHREAGEGEEKISLESRACVKMLVVGGVKWVPQPQGSEFISRGSTIVRRYDCGNQVWEVVYVPEQTPPPPPTPVTPHQRLELVVLVEWTGVVIPPLPPAPPPGQVVTLVWEGKAWYWKYTPLWCVDVHRLKDVYRPAACAAAAVAGYWLAGGFSAELFKLPVRRAMPMP